MTYRNAVVIAADATSFGTVVATLAGWLPPIAALLSIIWVSIQIYEWARKKMKGNVT